MELSIQERPKDLCVERGLMLEQLAEETHLSKSAFSCYPALRLYRLSKSRRGIGVVSLTMGNTVVTSCDKCKQTKLPQRV